MKNKNSILIGLSILSFAIAIITVTYAYFSANIMGAESTSSLNMASGRMIINYQNNSSALETAANVYPRGTLAEHTNSDAWITKSFTLTGNNTTDIDMEYEVGLDIISNTFNYLCSRFSLIKHRKLQINF